MKCPYCGGSGDLVLETPGARLQAILVQRLLSGRELARMAGVSTSTVSRILRDAPCVLSNMATVCDALELSLDWVITGKERTP